jgi:branched-chain amino acid transport system ATP-binding protein
LSADLPVLRAEDVRAGYGAGDIIHGVSVSVAAGTVASVVGPNGSGKSTLLKALAGVLRPSSGRVLADGRDLTGLPPEEVARAGIGYVPQTDDVFAPLTVRENLEMGGYLLDKREVSARVEHVTGVFPRLGQMLTRRAGRLSGGERKMLAMGRVLMIEPAVFLLDEPTANLAPKVAAELLTGHVRALAEAGAAVLVVEQRARAVLAISDYTYVLGGGRVLMDGTPARLAASQEFTESFFGAVPKAPKLSGAPGEHGRHELTAAAHAELVERRGQVLLDGVGRDVQFLDDLAGGVPPDDQRDHPGLRAGEPVRAEQQGGELGRGGGLDDDADLRRGPATQPGRVQGEPLPGAAAQPDHVR